MTPIGHINSFTGRAEKQRVYLINHGTAVFRIVYENKHGELFVRDKGEYVQVIKRGRYGDYYTADNSKRDYKVEFEISTKYNVIIHAESEDSAKSIVANKLCDGWNDFEQDRIWKSTNKRVIDATEVNDV